MAATIVRSELSALNEQPWIDAGVNLFAAQFDADRSDVLSRATAAGVQAVLLIGSDIAESQANIDYIAQQQSQPTLFTTAGVHPHQAGAVAAEWLEQLRQCFSHDSVVAVGECGLDFNRMFSPMAAQIEVFTAQLELSKQLKKPVYLHERDAFDTQISLLKNQHIHHGIAHCFTGNSEQLSAYLAQGLYIGITGWLCDERRGQDLQAALAYLPLDRLILETDAPYLLPRNLANKPKSRRNEPAFIAAIAEEVARLKQCSVADVAEASKRNVQQLLHGGS
jgi:TatD DNase family protein